MIHKHLDEKVQSLLSIIQRFIIPQCLINIFYSIRFSCWIHPKAPVQFSTNISFGKGVRIKPFVKVTTIEGKIHIGEHTFINSMCSITTRNSQIYIGKYVQIGSLVSIAASNKKFDRIDQKIVEQGYNEKGIFIHDDVWIGNNSVILDGVEIGRGSVIGAGSVVTKSIPPYCVVVGNPARIIRKRGEDNGGLKNAKG